MDSLGIEPRASRMLSGCDTTTPTALLKGWTSDLALGGLVEHRLACALLRHTLYAHYTFTAHDMLYATYTHDAHSSR